MAAALLEFFITLAFLFLYATQYYLRFDRLNWPCLDFLRCVSAIIIFLVVSFAAVTSRDGAAIAAFYVMATAGAFVVSSPLLRTCSHRCLASSWFPSLPTMPSRSTGLRWLPGPPRRTSSDPELPGS
ncbi:CKLF-like MARVEL transmembrane domain-containing protein 5 isoform X3 [Ailuropoda melanoleuca]|nr:CKLF-like MARVEL transmembrane domain-containing protein 5 isoform X3 [Ailuropoda melanoleuca]XP_019657153.1 CKLF-like MARVEL transmembrane domain-containing protein 5 isoform X3 [Ailuropoda melanoleuca]